MADRSKARLVDGFTTLRATQRYAREPRYSSAPDHTEKQEESPTSSPQGRKQGMQIGRTVMPTKYEIVCYSCGFAFVMRGRAKITQCPKCGTRLGLTDETITGAFSEELITAGKVHLTDTAILDGGHITANDVLLDGSVKSGFIHAYKTLEISSSATLPEDLFTARSLRVGIGTKLNLSRTMEVNNVDVLGELQADLNVEGKITIYTGGHFKGKLKAGSLVVEEGGGLSADTIASSDDQPIDDMEEEEERIPPKIPLNLD